MIGKTTSQIGLSGIVKFMTRSNCAHKVVSAKIPRYKVSTKQYPCNSGIYPEITVRGYVKHLTVNIFRDRGYRGYGMLFKNGHSIPYPQLILVGKMETLDMAPLPTSVIAEDGAAGNALERYVSFTIT